jgi:hypothetical protein
VAVENTYFTNLKGRDIRHESCPNRESVRARLDHQLGEPGELAATLIRARRLTGPQANSTPHLGYL